VAHFQPCFDFIDAARSRDGTDGVGGVLVHCYVGFSRSATIVLSYLMRKEALTFRQALDSVRKLRNIGPNPGFQQQLRLYEKMGAQIQSNHAEYRTYCLEKLTDKGECHGQADHVKK
jgi:dual specificity phosphatase 12